MNELEKKSGVRVYRCPRCRVAWQFCYERLKIWEILEGWGNIALQYEKLCPNCDLKLKGDMLKKIMRRKINARNLVRKKRLRKELNIK